MTDSSQVTNQAPQPSTVPTFADKTTAIFTALPILVSEAGVKEIIEKLYRISFLSSGGLVTLTPEQVLSQISIMMRLDKQALSDLMDSVDELLIQVESIIDSDFRDVSGVDPGRFSGDFAKEISRELQEDSQRIDGAAKAIQAVTNISVALGLTNPDPGPYGVEKPESASDTEGGVAKVLKRFGVKRAQKAETSEDVDSFEPSWQSPPMLDTTSTEFQVIMLTDSMIRQLQDKTKVVEWLSTMGFTPEDLLPMMTTVAVDAQVEKYHASVITEIAHSIDFELSQKLRALGDIRQTQEGVRKFFSM